MELQVFGKTLIKSVSVTQARSEVDFLRDQMWLEKAAQSGNTGDPERPAAEYPFISSDEGAKIPMLPYPKHWLYHLTKDIDALRLPIYVLKREIFRNGVEIMPLFRYRCKNCDMEYSARPIDFQSNKEVCSECGGRDFDTPVPAQRKVLAKLLKNKQNDNGQGFLDIAKRIEMDLDIADEGYWLLLFTYEYDADGNITKKILKEMIAMYPPEAYLMMDRDGKFGYNDKNEAIFICPNFDHRAKPITLSKDALKNKTEDRPRCPQCGVKCLRCIIQASSIYGAQIPNPKRIYYGEGEVVMGNGKYWTDLGNGYSIIYTVWSKVMSMGYMDEYVRKYFDKMRPPKGLLVIGSKNYASLLKAWDKIKTDAKIDPYSLHPLMVELDKGGRNMVQYVNLTGTLEDLKFIDVRDEFRRTIGALYGVMNLFSGDLPNGWNQEGLQAMVTNRAVESGQGHLEEKFFDPIARMLGVTDWVIRFKSNEEMDDMRDEQLRGQKIANAAQMQGMNFEVKLDGEGNFVFSQEPIAHPMTAGKVPSEGSAKPKQEQMTNFDSEPLESRPSDAGGIGGGHPASGDGTSLSEKTIKKKSLKKTVWIPLNKIGGKLDPQRNKPQVKREKSDT